MLHIKRSGNYSLEKDYIISLLFHFLGIKINIEKGDEENYVIEYRNTSIRIKDAFFASSKGENVANKANWPTQIVQIKVTFGNGELCFLYGEDRFEITNSSIYCGGDIFGSAFFMLTRWEELVLPKDRFGRCDENEMFVVKHGLYKRPIVNEYIELLRRMLVHIGVEVKSEQKYHPFITHDVDDLFRFASVKNFCKNLAGDILHRKSMKAFFKSWKRYCDYRLGKMKDPFDTFDEIMDLSDLHGMKDAFYFMPTYSSERDARYDVQNKRIKSIVEHIERRGHEVGIHPSKNTFHDASQFGREVGRLRKVCPHICGGRQHYLLYDLPETLETWEENNLSYDAGLGFAFRGGFRCGICYPYPFFDVVKRKQLSLTVRPLIVMEAAMLRGNTNLEEVKNDIFDLADVVKTYDGEFVFLWHTDNLHRHASQAYSDLYKEIVEHIAQK